MSGDATNDDPSPSGMTLRDTHNALDDAPTYSSRGRESISRWRDGAGDPPVNMERASLPGRRLAAEFSALVATFQPECRSPSAMAR